MSFHTQLQILFHHGRVNLNLTYDPFSCHFSFSQKLPYCCILLVWSSRVGPSLACRYAALLRALAQHLSVELRSLLSYVRVLIFGLVSDGFLKADVYMAL